MTDNLTADERSRLMARIGPKDTKPELIVRRFLHRLGYRYRLHARDLPGRPDIVFRSRKVAVFVHGCYWHRHPDCRFAYTPKSRVDFWTDKFEQNVARDERVSYELEARGWSVVVVWECQAKAGDLAWLPGRIERADIGAADKRD